MNFLFKGEIVEYDFFEAGNEIDLKNNVILFLHGWGGNKNSFRSTINLLKHKFNILTISMPTIAPTCQSWTLQDYANLVFNILMLYNITSIFVVCHSFGFRVACLLKLNIEIKKIVVTGGAGLKKFSVFKKIKLNNNIILLKQKRFKFLYNSVASADYKMLSLNNKKTFNNVISINTKHLCEFDCPMLLFWGKHDNETKLWMAKFLKKINKANLILTNGNHFAYLKYEALFNNAVLEFLK